MNNTKHSNPYRIVDGVKSIPLSAFPEEAWHVDGESNSGVGKMYDTVGFLARCVEIRANALVALPWSITRGKRVVFESGNPTPPTELAFLGDLDSLLWLTEASLCLVSQAFWSNEANGIRWLMPTTVAPVWDRSSGLVGFKRTVGDNIINLGSDEVVYFSLSNPLHETAPRKSPVETALADAHVIFNLNQFTKHFFERGAIKATLLTVPTATTVQQRKELKTWWQRFTHGVRDAFETGIISADVKPTVIGEGMSEIENGALTTEKKESIATALGIPHSIMMANAANRATAMQDEANFFNWTIIPDARLVAKEINKQLLKSLGLHFQFKPQEHPAFQEDESVRAASVKAYVQAGMKLSMATQILGVSLPTGMRYEELDS